MKQKMFDEDNDSEMGRTRGTQEKIYLEAQIIFQWWAVSNMVMNIHKGKGIY